MPVYDYQCDKCGADFRDIYETKVTMERGCPYCGGVCKHMWRTSAAVIGDEIDVTVRHGLCHSDGTPQRFTSRIEMHREAARRGLTNRVEHVGNQGSDKNRNTSRWV